ncbi:MAG: hypothetical protein AMXMBFR13_44310 [Phycisphaerae bacterium]
MAGRKYLRRRDMMRNTGAAAYWENWHEGIITVAIGGSVHHDLRGNHPPTGDGLPWRWISSADSRPGTRTRTGTGTDR